jgi:hypothetical protein
MLPQHVINHHLIYVYNHIFVLIFRIEYPKISFKIKNNINNNNYDYKITFPLPGPPTINITLVSFN